MGRLISGEQSGDDLERVVQQVEPVACRWERDPELVVLLVEPGGAQSQLQAPVGSVVDRERLRGEHRRVPVRHAGDEQAEANPGGDARQRGEGRHALEGLAGAGFFFQAEDGIRDLTVTGVQTCALPIWDRSTTRARSSPRWFVRGTAPRARTA